MTNYQDLLEPRLWLEQRVVGLLNARTGLGRPVAKERYGCAYFGRTAEMWGYSFCFEHSHPHFKTSRFLMLSRTHVAFSEIEAVRAKPTREQLVKELSNDMKKIPEDKFGQYHKDLDVPGTYATIECFGTSGRYFFMVSESGRMQPYKPFESMFRDLKAWGKHH